MGPLLLVRRDLVACIRLGAPLIVERQQGKVQPGSGAARCGSGRRTGSARDHARRRKRGLSRLAAIRRTINEASGE